MWSGPLIVCSFMRSNFVYHPGWWHLLLAPKVPITHKSAENLSVIPAGCNVQFYGDHIYVDGRWCQCVRQEFTRYDMFSCSFTRVSIPICCLQTYCLYCSIAWVPPWRNLELSAISSILAISRTSFSWQFHLYTRKKLIFIDEWTNWNECACRRESCWLCTNDLGIQDAAANSSCEIELKNDDGAALVLVFFLFSL